MALNDWSTREIYLRGPLKTGPRFRKILYSVHLWSKYSDNACLHVTIFFSDFGVLVLSVDPWRLTPYNVLVWLCQGLWNGLKQSNLPWNYQNVDSPHVHLSPQDVKGALARIGVGLTHLGNFLIKGNPLCCRQRTCAYEASLICCLLLRLWKNMCLASSFESNKENAVIAQESKVLT